MPLTVLTYATSCHNSPALIHASPLQPLIIQSTLYTPQCRRGETQSRAPNQPNQIHTTPDTELRRSRTKKKPRQTSCIWFNRQPILLQSSPIKLSSQSLSPKLSEPNSITKTLILDS